MVTNKISLWRLGNTTIRNPERIPGALKIIQMYYHNKKSFSGNQEQQGEFMQNILTPLLHVDKLENISLAMKMENVTDDILSLVKTKNNLHAINAMICPQYVLNVIK